MKNVTTKFLQDIQETRNFGYVVTMDFANGETKVLDDPSDLMSSGCEITTSAETSSFPLGNAIGKTLTLALPNQDERWSEYDFYGCDIKVELTHPSLDTNIVLGYFTVIEPETYGATVEITGVDKMHKFDKAFNKSSVSLPVSLMSLMVEACQQAQVSYQGAHFENDNYTISVIPDNMSCRDIIGNIAMLAGGNAIINDYGTVSIVTYSMDRLYNQVDYNGGTYDTETTPYSDGDTLDGGDFTYSDTDEVSGGTFNELRDYHVLFKGSKITLSTDDVVITGVQTEIKEVVYPTNLTLDEGYILSITNPLLEGNTEASINTIMASLNQLLVFNDTISADHPRVTGLRFRIFDIDHVSYPIADFADVCYVIDRKNRYYKSIITDMTFAFKGYTTFKCTAEPPARNSTKYQGAETKAIIVAKELVEQEKTERELAIEETQNLIENSPGLYETKTASLDNLPAITKYNLKITFNSQCENERGCDVCSFYIMFRNNYDRKAIFERANMSDYAGKSIVIPFPDNTPGDIYGVSYAEIYFRTDGSVTRWGMKIDKIELTTDAVTITPFDPLYYSYESSGVTNYITASSASQAETPHPYADAKRYRIYMSNSCFPTYSKPMYYVLHNKPTMAESNIWWVSSADVMYVSTDGGKTFNASLSADGNAIVNRLSAVGISADWIHAGEIVIGGSGTSAKIVVKNSSDKVMGGWDKDGILTTSVLGPSDIYGSRTLIQNGVVNFKGTVNGGSTWHDIANMRVYGDGSQFQITTTGRGGIYTNDGWFGRSGEGMTGYVEVMLNRSSWVSLSFVNGILVAVGSTISPCLANEDTVYYHDRYESTR